MTDSSLDDEAPATAVARLVRLLELEELEVDLFRGHNPNTWPGGRVFGGLVASQALRAAMATVEPGSHNANTAHRIHSLHAYFLRPGQPGVPMVFQVDRIRDGRSFTTRNGHRSSPRSTFGTSDQPIPRPTAPSAPRGESG